MIMIQMK